MFIVSSRFYPLRPTSHAATLRCARPAPPMSLCLLSSRSLHPITSRHLSPAASAPPLQPPHAPASLRLSPASTSAPSPTCALQCPHFQSCSGCTHELNLDRPSVVDDAVNFFKSLGVSDFTFDSCKLWGWRCRAKLAVRGSSADPLIGLYEEGTHSVVDIPNCKAHHPNINAAMELLKQGIRDLGIEPHDEDRGTGDLRYVQMAVTTYNTSIPASERYQHGRVQVALVWNSRNENSPNSDKLNALARFLWRNSGSKRKVPLIHSVWANFQTSTSNVIFGNRWRHLLGDRDFWEHLGGIDVSLAPSSFGQANTRDLVSLAYPWLLQENAGKNPEGRKQASASLRISLPVSPLPWRDGALHLTEQRLARTWEMGSCTSAQRSSSLESAVKRSLSSASQMEKPMGAHHPRSAAVGVPPASRRTPTFSDFGSKEDKFFDSQAWMESDCKDEFFSVKGDFTPSRGNTPVHDSFFASTPQRITTFFKDETLGSIPKATPAGGKKKLAELFQESFRGGQCLDGDNKYANNPTNLAWGFCSASGADSVHSSKRTAGGGGSTIVEEKHVTPFQDCLSSLVSCGGSTKRRSKMTSAIAIHG